MPQLSQKNRTATIAREVSNVPDGSERHRIPWKGGHQVCPVIELALDAVVLNPGSHRLQAQLASHPDRASLVEEPFGPKAQDLLGDLLREHEGFEDLKANLDEDGQHHPGVTTRTGLLVNGNRRAVALRDLGQQYIRLAVLPPNASERQIAELELQLQMTKDFKEDYTFTNRLLFVEELRTEYNYAPKQIALMLRYAQSSDERHLKRGIGEVEQATRMLSMIREIQDISGGMINYVHFDAQQVALEELDATYEKLKAKKPTEAERLRITRFTGLIVASGYKVLRQMDGQFLGEYLCPALEDNAELDSLYPVKELFVSMKEHPEEVQDPNLNLLGPSDELSADVDDPSPAEFARWISTLGDYVERPDSGDVRVRVRRAQLLECISDSLERAAEQSKLDAKQESRVDAPQNRVREATVKVRRAETLLAESVRPIELDVNKFRFRLKKLEKAVQVLRATFDDFRSRE